MTLTCVSSSVICHSQKSRYCAAHTCEHCVVKSESWGDYSILREIFCKTKSYVFSWLYTEGQSNGIFIIHMSSSLFSSYK